MTKNLDEFFKNRQVNNLFNYEVSSLIWKDLIIQSLPEQKKMRQRHSSSKLPHHGRRRKIMKKDITLKIFLIKSFYSNNISLSQISTKEDMSAKRRKKGTLPASSFAAKFPYRLTVFCFPIKINFRIIPRNPLFIRAFPIVRLCCKINDHCRFFP